jgi:hypothetical protein
VFDGIESGADHACIVNDYVVTAGREHK